MNVGDSGSQGGGKSQDFDINLAPIIDCFTVLITFMLVSASLLAIGVFDASLATEGQATPESTPPATQVSIELNGLKEIQLKLSGKGKLDKKIPALGNEWDTAALLEEIQAIKKQWPDTRSFVLNAQDDLEYIHIVRIIEVLKPHLASTLLKGL